MPWSNSAVAEFWKTYAYTPDETRRVQRRKKSNDLLPAELLIIIFRLVYEQEIVDPRWVWRHGNPRSPSLFPYAVAAVCSLWRDVMALVPEFWTCVAILVDPTLGPPISVIQSHVSWSGNLPLQITVTRTNFDHGMVDVEQERVQVMSIMNTVINPCMPRVRRLRFDVMFSSSLPRFPDGFYANTITHLELRCKEDNGGCPDVRESVTPILIESQFPCLTSLGIDGRNYYTVCKKGLWRTAKFTCLMALTIANYTPLRGESFTSSDFLLPITIFDRVPVLTIDNITLVPTPSPIPTLSRSRYLVELILTDIHRFETIIEILRVLGGTPELIFTRCTVGDPKIDFGGEGARLTLDEIDADQNLVPLLRRWKGKYLTILDCPSFDDALLEMMTFNGTAAQNLVTLDIVDCNNFSGASLRRFVHERHLIGHGITEIDVSGRAPDISVEDREWLAQSLHGFYYEPPYESSLYTSSSCLSCANQIRCPS